MAVVEESGTDFSHSRTFLGSAHVDAVHRGLHEREKVTQRLVVGQAEHKVRLEEFVEGRDGGVRLTGNGLLLHDDEVILDATLPLSDTEKERGCWLTPDEDVCHALPCLKDEGRERERERERK